MTIWNKKLKIWRLKQFIEDFSLFIKKHYHTESKNPKFVKTKNGRIMLLLKYAVYGSEKIEIYQRTRIL